MDCVECRHSNPDENVYCGKCGAELGLTIAQTFIAQHNGAIECESIPGHTIFTVLLPLELNRPGT